MLNLTEERKQKIKEELNRAYIYLGVEIEWDKENRIKVRMKCIETEEEEVLKIEGKELTGIFLPIAIHKRTGTGKDDEKGECIITKEEIVFLFVNSDTTKYILEKSDCYIYLDKGESEFKNIEHKLITLSRIGKRFYAMYP